MCTVCVYSDHNNIEFNWMFVEVLLEQESIASLFDLKPIRCMGVISSPLYPIRSVKCHTYQHILKIKFYLSTYISPQMSDLLEESEVRYSSLSVTNLIPTGLGVSLTFEIVLSPTTSQEALTAFSEYLSNGLGLMGFGRYQVDQNLPVGVFIVSPTGELVELWLRLTLLWEAQCTSHI